MLRSIGYVSLGTQWKVRPFLTGVGLLLTILATSIPTARPQGDKTPDAKLELTGMRPSIQAQAATAAPAASGPAKPISITRPPALVQTSPSKPPFRPNPDAKRAAPVKASDAPGAVRKSSPESEKQEEAEADEADSAALNLTPFPAPSSRQSVVASTPSRFSAAPAVVSTADPTSEDTAGGGADGADGSGGAEDVLQSQAESAKPVEGLEPMRYYEHVFPESVSWNVRPSWTVKRGETIQQVLRSKRLADRIMTELNDYEATEAWLQLQVETPIVYLDKPIVVDAELIKNWTAKNIELQLVAVPGGGGGEPDAVNATAHKQPPLQLVCRKATSAFIFKYTGKTDPLTFFRLSGPLVIRNCSKTAVVIEEAQLTPQHRLAEKGPGKQSASTSRGGSDPEANPRVPDSNLTQMAVVFSHVHFTNNSGTKGGALRVGAGRIAAMRHAVFQDNTAAEGAAILLEEGALLLGVLNSRFERNSPLSPDDQGSAISLQPGACWAFCGIINSTFISNRGRKGGAVHAAGAPSSCNFLRKPGGLTDSLNQKNWISGCEFKDNHALEDGGSVYYRQIGEGLIDGASHVHLHNVTMEHNKALGGSGGAVWISTQNGLLISNYSTIHGNAAAAAGGGIWFSSPGLSFLQFNSTTLTKNAAGLAAVQLQQQQQAMAKGRDATASQVPGSKGLDRNATSGRHLLQAAAAGPNADELIRLARGSLAGASPTVAEALIGSGGAVGAGGSINVIATQLKVADNTATRSGGGLYCHACLSVIIAKGNDTKLVQQGSSEWVGNMAGGSGGAIATYVLKGLSKIMEAKFQDNRAGLSTLNSGGCISNISDQASLCPCGFGGGGAVCLQSLSDSITVTNSNFEGNAARFGGAAFVDTSLCSHLGMACPVNMTKGTFSKNTAAVSGLDIFWTDVDFATTQPGSACLLGLLNTATGNGTYCSNSSNHTISSSSKEFVAVRKALNGLRSGQCSGNKFLGTPPASQQQLCKALGSRPSRMEVQLTESKNSSAIALESGTILQEQAHLFRSAEEGFVVANDVPFNVAATLKDAVGNTVVETDVPVDVSLQSRGTAIRQPAATSTPSGQYLLQGVATLSINIGRQKVAAIAVMGEEQVAVQELALYIRRCAPGEITVGGGGSSAVCKHCGPNMNDWFMAQVSFNPNNGSCDACPDGAEVCDGVLLTPKPDTWHSHPFSLKMHPCPIQDSCFYQNRSQTLTDWRKVKIRDGAALEKLLLQQGGFAATNSSAFKALFSQDQQESASYMQQLLLVGDSGDLIQEYNNMQCSQAYTGVLCGRCRSGYGGSGNRGNRCYKCLRWVLALVVWILSRVFDLGVVALSVWYRRMQVKIKTQETRRGPPLEFIPDVEGSPAVLAGGSGQPGQPSSSGETRPPSRTEDTVSPPSGLRRRDQQASRDHTVAGEEGSGLSGISKGLKKYGWTKGLYNSSSQEKRHGALVHKEVVSQLDKPTVLLQSLLSFKTGHWVDAAAILEVLLVMTQMLGLLSRIQGVWDNLIISFLSFIDVSSSTQTWTSFDCLYALPDDDPNSSKAYYRTLISFLQPFITVILILLCAACTHCVKSAIYNRLMRVKGSASDEGEGGAGIGPSTITEASEADRAAICHNSIVPSGTATALPSEPLYGIQASMSLSHQAGEPLPGLWPYVRKFIGLTVSTAVLYFYSTVTVQLMALFSCRQVDPGGAGEPYVEYMRAVGYHWSQDYGVKCFTGAHLVWVLALGVPGLLIFSIGMPLSGFVFLYRNRHRLFQPLFKTKYGQLYDHFRPRYYWWGLLRFATLLLLTITVEGLRSLTQTVQMIVFLAIMTAYTFATLCYYPWMTLLLNSLSLLTLTSVLVTSYLCLTFVGDGGSSGNAWPGIARVLIIIINSAVVALLLMHLMAATKDIVLEYLKIAARAVAAQTERIRGGSAAKKRVAERPRAKNTNSDVASAAAVVANSKGSDAPPPSAAAAGVESTEVAL